MLSILFLIQFNNITELSQLYFFTIKYLLLVTYY